VFVEIVAVRKTRVRTKYCLAWYYVVEKVSSIAVAWFPHKRQRRLPVVSFRARSLLLRELQMLLRFKSSRTYCLAWYYASAESVINCCRLVFRIGAPRLFGSVPDDFCSLKSKCS
jgi:hypothetical protein